MYISLKYLTYVMYVGYECYKLHFYWHFYTVRYCFNCVLHKLKVVESNFCTLQ